ncbi:MAG: thiamine phosphate synthase [Methanobrevibacter sp.]|jgi:thiamine-phosphate pyrophosphorylase|nr:thiamine phosphate synthase [Candidatus Methanoflexus mossambicus]
MNKMNKNLDLSLYLVTNSDNKPIEDFLAIVEESIKGGVTIVQIREKYKNSRDFYNLAKSLKKITDKYNVPLIVNDRIDIAIAIDCAGVHLGQEDIPCNVARKMIGNDKILGISANTITDAEEAEENGADYIGSGAIFPTKSKDAECITINNLKEIVESVNIPVVAIGGINEENSYLLKDTKIKGISVISSIMNSNNPKIASKRLLSQFKEFNNSN